jgi:hypothetical protein
MREIMAFPREKLPQVARLLRLLRQEFAPTTSTRGKSSWETDLLKFRNTVSGTDEFMARKADEKVLEQ